MSVTVEPAAARTGAAGRRGDRIRSDAWVEVELRDGGGIELELTSRVEPYFGEAIRGQVSSVLAALGVNDARVVVEDTGALPFVLQARLEAAARAAGLEAAGDARPERTTARTAPVPRRRLRRSRLYVPGNEPKMFVSAGLYQADGIILDLEDSVHPDAKTAARFLVRNALRCVDFMGAERMVRINQLPLGLEDLEAVVPERPDLILIPKVESPDQVAAVADKIDRVLASGGPDGAGGEPDDAGGRTDGPIWLMPIIESALGIERAFEIATASDTVAALTIGLEDYSADLGVPKTPDGAESAYARKRLVNAARAAGVQAIDSVYGDVDDLDGLYSWGVRARGMGYEGMGCIHPRQIQVIHQAFQPTGTQIHKALKIVEAFRAAQAEGRGVVSLGSKMIDAPVVKQAVALVEQAKALGLLPDGDHTEAD